MLKDGKALVVCSCSPVSKTESRENSKRKLKFLLTKDLQCLMPQTDWYDESNTSEAPQHVNNPRKRETASHCTFIYGPKGPKSHRRHQSNQRLTHIL